MVERIKMKWQETSQVRKKGSVDIILRGKPRKRSIQMIVCSRWNKLANRNGNQVNDGIHGAASSKEG